MKISIIEEMKFRQKIVGYAMDYSQANRHKNAKNFVNRRSICLTIVQLP